MPAFVYVALAIKLEDDGSIFYHLECWGRNGNSFRAYKFRTMVPNSDHNFGITQARENDPPITRVARILRAMGLDELPQRLNILKGHMSFVGPRSLAVGEIVQDRKGHVVKYENVPGFWERLSVRPSRTGLATIYIPKYAPSRHKFRYDQLYIRKQSFWFDVGLVVLSFWISLRGKWRTRSKNT